MAALELSIDKDWARYRRRFSMPLAIPAIAPARPAPIVLLTVSTLSWTTRTLPGAIQLLDHEGIRLTATGVALVTPMSLLPDLRSSKEEGQRTSSTRDLRLQSGRRLDVTPKLRTFVNSNYLRFDRTEPLQLLLFQQPIRHSIGTDFGAGFEYRPPLSENIVFALARRLSCRAGITGHL